MDWDLALSLFKALREEGVRYVLVGGVAMILHGRARATRDVDLFVSPDAKNVERLRRALRKVTGDDHVDEIRAEDLSGEFPAIQYVSPDGTLVIDIISRLGEAFAYDDIAFEEAEVGETVVRVATPEMLFRMKRGTLRDVDRMDASWLQSELGIEDEEG